MDPTRDATNPFVGLAFKLEVTYFFISTIFAQQEECVTPFPAFSLTGREVWPADIRASVPGLSEEGGIHLQHTHKQKSQSPEARASPR